MIYIASPYSSPIAGLPDQRYDRVRDFTKHLMNQGLVAFSPIVYAHRMATELSLPTDAEFWHQFNMDFLKIAHQVFVLRLPGWDQSKGVRTELNVAKILGIPTVHFGEDYKMIGAPATAVQVN